MDTIGTRLQYIRGKGKPCQGGVLVKERRFKCFAVALCRSGEVVVYAYR